MIRVVIKGKQGEGKTTLAGAISTMLTGRGISHSVQDGADQPTQVHKIIGEDKRVVPVTVAIIVKQA